MTLKTAITADLSVFYQTGEFADTITYKAGGTGDGTSISAILDVGRGRKPEIQTTAPPDQEMLIMVQTADVATPNSSDTFTISGTVWYLRQVVGGGPTFGEWLVLISKSAWRKA